MLTINYPDGSEETITQLLNHYGMVVRGKEEVESLLSDPIQVMALKHKLELAAIELRHTRDLLALERTNSIVRFESLEAEVQYLKQQLSLQLSSTSNNAKQLIDALNHHLKNVANDPLMGIVKELVDSVVQQDKESLELAVAQLSDKSPSLLERVHTFMLTNAAGGVIGNYVYDWLKIVWPILPK